MNGLALAFGLLTAVPVRRLPDVARSSAGRAMLLAPLTTVPMLLVLAGGHLLTARVGVPGTVVAALVVALEVGYTRGLHLDGLADTGDGLAASHDASRSLQVMKASDIGPAGVVSLVLALLLQVAALGALLASYGGTALAALAWLGSRHALAWACRAGVPAASTTGLGVLVAGSVTGARLAIGAGVVLVLAAGLVMTPGLGWWHGPVVLLVLLVAGEVVVRRCRARLGGVTGDVLGAVVEVALSAGLVAGVVLLAR